MPLWEIYRCRELLEELDIEARWREVRALQPHYPKKSGKKLFEELTPREVRKYAPTWRGDGLTVEERKRRFAEEFEKRVAERAERLKARNGNARSASNNDS